MKHILVPTDFSECADRAAQVAASLAKISGAKLHFYHNMIIPINWIMLEQHQEQMYPDVTKSVNENKSQLQEYVNKAQKDDIEAEYFLDFESSSDAISRYAESHHIDLIVMGSHGASGVKELFIGSNAQRMVRNATVPVFIVKDKTPNLEVPKVLFASDFEPEMMTPFIKVVEFAEMLDAKIHLIYINTPADFKRSWVIHEKMESFRALASSRLEKSEIVDCMYFEEGIEKYCEIHHTDLITIATHHRKGLSRAILGSLTERIVNHVDLPVMSVPL